MLNEVVNDGSSASGGSRSGLSRRLEHLSAADSSDAASAILSESLSGQMNGIDEDWEVKLREKLAPETKTKHRSKKVSDGVAPFVLIHFLIHLLIHFLIHLLVDFLIHLLILYL